MNTEFNFLIYNSSDENVSVNAVIKDETIWLSQKSMAELFDVEVPAVSKHLANIFADGELNRDSTVSKMEIVQQEGSRHVKRSVEFYNLDAIISVGYRVNSKRATHFRIWATGVLKEYMIKGFALDDDRLKQGKTAFGKDYFRELLELRRYDILKDKGKISKRKAEEKAFSEYDEFNKTQKIESDFDKIIKKIESQ